MKGYYENKNSGEPYDAIEKRGGPKVSMHYILGGNKIHVVAGKAKVLGPSKYDKPSLTGELDGKYSAAKRPATAA